MPQLDRPLLRHPRLNLVELPQNLTADNFGILRSADVALSCNASRQIRGSVHLGHVAVKVSARAVVPGQTELILQTATPSVTAQSFGLVRRLLGPFLQPLLAEGEIARKSGIEGPMSQDGASRMAAYAACLFSEMFFKGASPWGNKRRFDATGPECAVAARSLLALRGAHVADLGLSGRTSVPADLPGPTVTAYLPSTTIFFDDGVTVPFVGYAAEMLVAVGSRLVPVPLQRAVWRTPTTPEMTA